MTYVPSCILCDIFGKGHRLGHSNRKCVYGRKHVFVDPIPQSCSESQVNDSEWILAKKKSSVDYYYRRLRVRVKKSHYGHFLHSTTSDGDYAASALSSAVAVVIVERHHPQKSNHLSLSAISFLER